MLTDEMDRRGWSSAKIPHFKVIKSNFTAQKLFTFIEAISLLMGRSSIG